jgi:hypothetical protein
MVSSMTADSVKHAREFWRYLELVMETSRLETSPRGHSSRIVSFTGSAPELEPVGENHVLRRKHAGRRQFMVM